MTPWMLLLSARYIPFPNFAIYNNNLNRFWTDDYIIKQEKNFKKAVDMNFSDTESSEEDDYDSESDYESESHHNSDYGLSPEVLASYNSS